MSRPLALALIVLAVACSGSSPDRASTTTPTAPTAPSPAPTPAPNPTPGPSVVTVTLTATNGGQPLPGVAATLAGTASTTDGNGQFSLDVPTATSSAPIEFTGPSIVPRRLILATRTRSVALNAIQLAGDFSLAYYRQLVRNGYQEPGNLQPLRRWTENPRIYLRTVFGAANRAIDTSSLDTVAAVMSSAVPAWSGGRMSVAQIERGTETREGVPGWITVVWTEDLGDRTCGNALIGANPGRIRLHPRNDGCRCSGDPAQVSRWVILHEVGHAMGFFHTANRDDVMFDTFNACIGAMAPRERDHAAIAYARPPGNVDPDTDPTSAVALVPSAVQVR